MDFIKNILTPTVITLLGAILVAVGAFWSSYLSQKRELEKEIDARKFQEELTVKNEELAKKSEEISRLNEEISKTLLGGDSFCYVTFSSPQTKNNITSTILMVIHQGKYPMYDIGIRIVDLDKFPPKNFTLEEVLKNDIMFNIPSISPNLSEMRGKINFENKTELKFNIFITARNGIYTELFRSKKIGDNWKTAIRVEKHVIKEDNTVIETIFEKIDEGFPLNKNGKVVW